ncbi:NAD(P)-binding domain-containing protein [Corynebacterium bovis]|uniref:NAD(P)-binding domain-containing protein n=2 Tax=Corynebacterium bovis TaxID=36808 RepID=UPI000F62ED57|nr:NAD(P)-binding domain-containing protein [Corynebacterium bovis]RRQ07971.1 NAD(P)/FAD-dependent oxidoreductase [Corynebacterium bovis]RRQ10466.1 NAD(P)/FAD-dependent oxidoreductase [Corynebacterium bovis]
MPRRSPQPPRTPHTPAPPASPHAGSTTDPAPAADTTPPTYRVIVVGAGQAGLAAAHALVRRGHTPGEDMLVLDSGEGPGGAWRDRWDSLTLGRAHAVADLPGLPLGDPDPSVPASRVVSDYYGRYEELFGLHVVRPATVVAVHSLSRSADDGTDDLSGDLELTVVVDGRCRRYRTRRLINATGTWTHPYIPHVPGIADFRGRQLHTVNYTRKEDFAGQRTVVVGGGASAVQFLLELAPVTDTLWATRRPPDFTHREFTPTWGRDVESTVRDRTASGLPPASVVRTTGIAMLDTYLAGVADGTLVSRGMFDRILPDGVHFPAHDPEWHGGSGGYGPAAADSLAVPESWRPFTTDTTEQVDVIFWNTGFRPALGHLAPLHLRGHGGGIRMADEVTPAADPRVLLVGYGSTASTVGATRAGRLAGKAASSPPRHLPPHDPD